MSTEINRKKLKAQKFYKGIDGWLFVKQYPFHGRIVLDVCDSEIRKMTPQPGILEKELGELDQDI